jgi:60 kDa SS-A/Ro ribonucleoprotein
VRSALESAFYTAFGNVEPTGKRILIALDVSASMTWMQTDNSDGITPRIGSAAMAMVTLAAEEEKNVDVVGFSSSLMELDIKKGMKLDAVSGLQGGHFKM